jgi:N6-adenosine-specific RNA methylase IME4
LATAASDTRKLTQLSPHPQAGLVPAMAEPEYAALRASIARRGIATPLEVTKAGVVLDGHHRLRVAAELGLASAPVRVVAVEDELEHMLLGALTRRHLSESQRAAAVVQLDRVQRLRRQTRRGRRATLPGRPRELAAELAAASARTVQDALTVHDEDRELFERVLAGELPAHRAAEQVRRRRRLQALPDAAPLPAGRYELIYADPPWQLGNPSAKYAPESYYPTLPLEEIESLAVPAADQAVLFLWTVNSLLPQALEVIAAWGFEYKTNFVWVKDWIGLGIWGRYRHELLLVARKGAFPPPAGPDRIDSVIEAARGRHSAKPACVYELLERMYPQASKLELFCRGRPRPGWSAWGNEVEAA